MRFHNYKLELFEQLSKGGAKDFFSGLGIDPLMPLLSMSPEDFQILWEYNLQQQRNLRDSLFRLSSHRESGRRKQETT
jgi:hypothetical protein